MKRIDELTTWDMETTHEPDGYNMREVPKPTQRNMEKLVKKVAELTKMVNVLAERQGLIEEEPDNTQEI